MKSKKINELTMMETASDAANVLVEENGEAKRVPAGKMVAGSLPEHLQFGETVVGGDTLTWDCNADGLLTTDDGAFCKISDSVPVKSDLQNGVIITIQTPDGPQETPIDWASLQESVWEDGFVALDIIFIAPSDDYAADGLPTLPKAGIWAVSNLSEMGYMGVSLTIPGYTGFVTKIVKPIEKKYLPGGLIPAYTAEDEGAVLKIVNGVPTWVAP